MVCILAGMVGVGLIGAALRPLAPMALRWAERAAAQAGGMPERVAVPVRADRRRQR